MMKRMALLIVCLMLLLCLPAMAEHVDALPVPEGCEPMFNYIGDNSVSYLDFSAGPDIFLGWVGEETAMFTEDTAEGRVFAGYVRTEDGWLRTASTPLPAGTVVNHSMTEGQLFYFDFPHPQGLTDEDGRAVWVNGIIRLEEDGVWRLFGLRSGDDRLFIFAEDGLFVDLTGHLYGECVIDRDVRTLDWATFPMDWQALVPLMSDRHGVIGADLQPLYADAAATLPLAEYRIGTPVTVLAREGGMARVRIADSDITGWVAEESLLLGAAQLLRRESSFLMAYDLAPLVRTGNAVPLFDAPEGNVVSVADGEVLRLMSETQNGWYHACRSENSHSVWFRVEDAADDGAQEAEAARDLILGPNAVFTPTSPVWYGTVNLPEDGTLPSTWEEALSLLDTDGWYVVREASASLTAEDGTVTELLLCGAPVRLISREDDRAQVAVAGSELRGWVDMSALIPVAEKLALPELAGPYAVDWHSPAAMTADGLALFGLCAEGFCGYVYEPATGDFTLVPVDLLPEELRLAAFIALHAPEYIPGELISTAYLGETTVMALICQPGQHPWQGGSMRFLGAEKEDGEWRVTLSAEFPAGVTPCLDNYHAGEGEITVHFQHPDLPEDPEEPYLTEAGFTLSLRDGRWLVDTVQQGEMNDAVFIEDNALYGSFGERFFGDFAFSRDVTEIDWRTFPLTMEAALDQTDMSRWAILHCDALLMDMPVVGVSLGSYYEGVWVRLREREGDWWRVELPGGVTGYVSADALAVPDSHIHITQPPEVTLRRGEPAIRLLDAPDGNLVCELDTLKYTVVRVLGESPDGRYYHILDEAKGFGAGYVLKEECTPCAGDLMNAWPVAGVSTADTDYILMQCPDGTMRLYCKLTEGVPTVSDAQFGHAAAFSAPLPADVQLAANPFGEPVVTFAASDGGTLAVTVRRDGDVWRIRQLTEDSGFRWMYAGGALITEETDVVIGAPGFETDITKADWLALPGSYEAALAMMPPDAEVCNNLEYWLGETTAMFLLQRPDGTIVLACSQRVSDGSWRVTYSSPLPEGTERLDTYHAIEGSITIFLPEGDANVALQDDDRWLLTWANDVSIGENRLWFGAGGPYYCDVPMERDMTRIDWATLPVAYEDWLPLVDASSWAVVTGAPAPLRGEDGSVIASYLPATPVRLLEARGGEYRVAIAGGTVTGWMDASALLIGEDQLDLNGEEGFTVVEDGFVWGVNCVVAAEGAWLFGAPGGEPLREVDFRLDVLAVYGDWLHVLDSWGTAGFVRAEDCTDFRQWLEDMKKIYDLP